MTHAPEWGVGGWRGGGCLVQLHHRKGQKLAGLHLAPRRQCPAGYCSTVLRWQTAVWGAAFICTEGNVGAFTKWEGVMLNGGTYHFIPGWMIYRNLLCMLRPFPAGDECSINAAPLANCCSDAPIVQLLWHATGSTWKWGRLVAFKQTPRCDKHQQGWGQLSGRT